MSHHFDTKLARENPRLNVCDLYLFEGAPGTTVMAMTVDPDANPATPALLEVEALYGFRFDLDGDAREEVTFTLQVDAARHADGDEHVHVQTFRVRRATGDDARRGAGGELLIEGETEKTATRSGVRAFVGKVADLFAGDAAALHDFLNAFYVERRYHADAFLRRANFFANRNVTAIVLEVPNQLIGRGTVHAWATTSLYGHAPEAQVSRWGVPLLTHLFLNDPDHQELRDAFNRSLPSDDLARVATPIAQFIERLTTYADSAADPSAYAKEIVARLCPATLPYELGTRARFERARFNGRPLLDDAMDVMLALASNRPLGDGVAPDPRRATGAFPYFGAPYSDQTPANHS